MLKFIIMTERLLRIRFNLNIGFLRVLLFFKGPFLRWKNSYISWVSCTIFGIFLQPEDPGFSCSYYGKLIRTYEGY